MASYSMDVELFISEVKKCPELWNNNCEDARSPLRRHQAWTDIARIFIEDFDDLAELEKNDVYKKLQNKWRNIRDSFVRHKRRNNGSSKKGYIYAKQLAFLEDVYHHKRSLSQSGSDADTNQNEGDDTWNSDVDDESKLKKILLKSGFEAKDDDIIQWADVDEPQAKKRRKKSTQKETQIDFVETNFPEASCSYGIEDEDRSFFLSLLPAIKDFDIDKKIEFRTEILNLVKKYRKNERPFCIEESE